MKKGLIGLVDAVQIQEWKTKHKGGIYAIQVDGHIAYFKYPSRAEVNMSMADSNKDAPLDLFETLAKATWLGGSEAVLNDDPMWFGAVQQLKVVIDGKKAEIVNL